MQTLFAVSLKVCIGKCGQGAEPRAAFFCRKHRKHKGVGMKKILIVSGSMNRGGAERVISLISNELITRGWNIVILTILDSRCGYQLKSGIKLVNISKKGQNQILSIPRLARGIRQIIRSEKPDTVVSFMIAINIVTWMATRGMHVRFTPSERNDPSTGRNMIFQILQKIVYKNADLTVFQTQRAKNFFSPEIRRKSLVIPNPIDIQVSAKEERKHKIVSIGRLEPQKNQELLIRAFNTVHLKNHDYTLEIYGDGSLRNKLQELIDSLDLTSSVYLRGNQKNVHEQIADAEMFVLSSNFEGLSNALLEAMMMGLPCISTNCAGSDEAIEDKVTGLLVRVGDQTGLAEAMDWMISNPILAKKMGEKGKESTHRYTKDSVVNQWESILSQKNT